MGMKYKKGMKRYRKAGEKYQEDDKGDHYMGDDKKMYKMEAPTLAGTVGGTGKPGDYKNKSEVTVDDFQKSLDQLAAIAKGDDATSRKEELLDKAKSGEELTEEERDELYKALGHGDDSVDDAPEIVKAIVEPMEPTDNEPLQKALDVSEYLESQHGALVKSLTEVAKSIDASDARQHTFNLVFAKAFHQVGELVKGMSERLGVIEKQPARAPKSKGITGDPAAPAIIEKGFNGEDPPAMQMSKEGILDGLEAMMRKSVDAGKSGMAECGEDILGATAKFEQVNQISKAMLTEIQEFTKANAH